MRGTREYISNTLTLSPLIPFPIPSEGYVYAEETAMDLNGTLSTRGNFCFHDSHFPSNASGQWQDVVCGDAKVRMV